MPQEAFVQSTLVDPGLVDPIVSPEVLQRLATGSKVNGHPDPDGSRRSADPLPSRRMELSRLRQVLLTSVPLIVADLCGLALSYWVSAIAVSQLTGRQFPVTFLNNLAGLCSVYLAIGLFHGLYPGTGTNPVAELRRQLTTMGMAAVILVFLNAVLGVVSWLELAVLAVAMVLIAVIAPVFRFEARRMCKNQPWWGESAIIVGTGTNERAVLRYLNQMPQRGLKPIGVVDEVAAEYWKNTSHGNSIVFLGETRDLPAICREHDCHWVILFAGDTSAERVVSMIEQSSMVPNIIMLYTNVMIPTLWTSTFETAGLAGVHIRDRLLQPFQRIAKRLIDLIVSGLLLVLLLPFWVAIVLMIPRISPGSVFYRHQRIGRSGRRFDALKIRTMVENSDEVLKDFLASNAAAAEEWRETQKLKNDPRIVPRIGSFLRRTSMDELPQLWNVFVGDMSLVGPRPIVTDEILKYSGTFPLYLRVRPGLTGLWQVSGRNNTTYGSRVRLDTYYVRNWSIWLDYYVLLRTVRTVIRREGSY